MSDAQDSRVGSMFGPYHLKRLLGRGGMGEVYEAEHTVKEWTVAVKLMTAEFSKDPVEAVHENAQSVSRINAKTKVDERCLLLNTQLMAPKRSITI
ncbi:hypothetical protein ABLN86_21335, partial [Mycobacterium tuberculosis]